MIFYGKLGEMPEGTSHNHRFLVAKSNSIRGFFRWSVRRSVLPSGIFQKPRIQQNSREFNKIQQNLQLFATIGWVMALLVEQLY